MALHEALDIHHLAGLIDGEGSFLPHHVETEGKWYPQVYFTITLEDTMEWRHLVASGIATYGGTWYPAKRPERPTKLYITWRITKTEQLEPFLNKIIPLLIIKRKDAEKIRRFLTRYKPYRDKASKTKEEAVALFEQLSA